jgi:hypothetical protein
MMEKPNVVERESLVLTRIYPVAPEKVWRAWTDPAALRIWWNQADSPGWLAELDVRVGDRYRVATRDPQGEYYDVRGAISGGTELVFKQQPIFDPRARDGWRGAFKRLGLLLQDQ